MRRTSNTLLALALLLCTSLVLAQTRPNLPPLRPASAGPGLPYLAPICARGETMVTVQWQEWYNGNDPIQLREVRRHLRARQVSTRDDHGRLLGPVRTLQQLINTHQDQCMSRAPATTGDGMDAVVAEDGTERVPGPQYSFHYSSGGLRPAEPCREAVLLFQLQLPARSWCRQPGRSFTTFRAGVMFYHRIMGLARVIGALPIVSRQRGNFQQVPRGEDAITLMGTLRESQ